MESKRPNNKKQKKLGHPRRVLRLPDLDHAKTAVLNTLLSLDSQRAYRFAMDDFIAWYCSEPRLAFNKTVVLRYKLQLDSRHLASSTINLRLAACAKTGLRGRRHRPAEPRVGGRHSPSERGQEAGCPTGQLAHRRGGQSAAALRRRPDPPGQAQSSHPGARSRLWASRERAHLTTGAAAKKGRALGDSGPDRQGQAYPNGPVPNWVKSSVDTWTAAAGISSGRVFRCVSKRGSVWGTGISEKVVWCVGRSVRPR